MRERRIKVFLSSAFYSLRSHQQYALASIMRHPWADPQCLETELVQPQSIKEISLQMVRESNVYVGLIGSKDESEICNISPLHLIMLEVAEAERLKIPILLFLSTTFDTQCNSSCRNKINEYRPRSFEENNRSLAESLSSVIPSASLAAEQVYQTVSQLSPSTIYARLRAVIQAAVDRYQIGIVRWIAALLSIR